MECIVIIDQWFDLSVYKIYLDIFYKISQKVIRQ